MEIIKSGFKEACGKLYFECSECGCGFAAGDEDVQRVEDGIYTKWIVRCPCCGERKTAYSYEYDELHADYIRRLSTSEIAEPRSNIAKYWYQEYHKLYFGLSSLRDRIERAKSYNQRTGREWWQDKPKEVQDRDIASSDKLYDALLKLIDDYYKDDDK